MGEIVGPLTGVRVLDLGVWRPVPYATALLADLGADVLKVEPPGGDPMRGFPGLFAGLTHHKRCITLDLKSDAGRERALELATDAHVVAEGFRAGVVERLGVGWDDVRARNPTVVYCSIRDEVAGHDVNYQASAGVLGLGPGEPVAPKMPWADLVGGLHAAYRIAAAVAGGKGARIVVAMTDVLAEWASTCRPPAVAGLTRTISGVAGYGVYATRDGHVALGVLDERHLWTATCAALGLDDVADLDFPARVERAGELQARIGAALAALTRDEAIERLQATGAPASAVRTADEIPAPDAPPAPAPDQHRGAAWL